MYTRKENVVVTSLVEKSQRLHNSHIVGSHFVYSLSKDDMQELKHMVICEQCLETLEEEKERRISNAQKRIADSETSIQKIRLTDRSDLLRDTKNQIFNLQHEDIGFENGANLVPSQPKKVKLAKITDFGQFRLKK